jgi:hypothetical protein
MTLTAIAFVLVTPVTAQNVDVTITVVNRGFSAWVVTSVEGSSGVARTRVQNPEMTLRTGVRYRIVNEAERNVHPFELITRNGRDTVLLSQHADVTGRFENDPDVDYMEGSRGITFTLTRGLMDELNGYRCTAHPSSMRGRITSPGEAAEGAMEDDETGGGY